MKNQTPFNQKEYRRQYYLNVTKPKSNALKLEQPIKEPQDPKEYQKRYYENVTKPKRAAQNPDRKQRAPMRKLGEPTVRNCEYPACEKEYVSNEPKRHYCSKSCGIRHFYDKKHGVERKLDEDFCLGCKQVLHITKFPIVRNVYPIRSKLCEDCLPGKRKKKKNKLPLVAKTNQSEDN